MREGTAELLASSDVLRGVPMELLRNLADRGKAVNLGSGQNLFYEGDDADSFFIVHHGNLKATRLSQEGTEQLLAVFKVGDVIGEIAIFDDAARSATISALKPSTLIQWRKRTFFDFSDANPEIYRHMLSLMSRRLRATNDALAARHFLPLKGQLAQCMLRLGEGFGDKLPDGTLRIAHRLTQSELAALIGASRENVSRVLNDWRRSGIIDRIDGVYHLLDTEELQLLSEG